jgi:hypothetical protein
MAPAPIYNHRTMTHRASWLVVILLATVSLAALDGICRQAPWTGHVTGESVAAESLDTIDSGPDASGDWTPSEPAGALSHFRPAAARTPHIVTSCDRPRAGLRPIPDHPPRFAR